MNSHQDQVQAASLNLIRTLSSVDLPGRISEDITHSPLIGKKEPPFIPESFSEVQQHDRRRLIDNFLTDIQSTVKAQMCSIFLINENGQLKREGSVGFDSNGLPIDATLLEAEEYPLDHSSAVGKAAESGNGRYGNYLYIDSIHDNCPVFVRIDKLQEYEAVFGRIDAAVFVPIHGPNSSFGVLRVFNKVNPGNKPIPKMSFSPEEQIYLAQAAAYFGANLRELRKNQDQNFALDLQNNILLNWALINQKVISSESRDKHRVHDEIFSIYHSILRHLTLPADSYVKSANLRLIRSDNKLAHVASYTRDEDGFKDNQPRQLPQLDRGARGSFNLVGEVAQSGKNCLIRDVSNVNSLNLFVNQSWIMENNLQDFLCIALKANGYTIGTLSLFTAKNRCLALEDQRYLEGVANSLGLYTSLIFSSPEVDRGTVDQNLLDSFLYSISPPQAINLSTLLLEDTSHSFLDRNPQASLNKYPVFKHHYDIALSYAIEDMNIAKEIATALRAKGLHTFYSDVSQENISNTKLYDHLNIIYGEISLCVVIISKDYTNSQWLLAELKTLVGYAKSSDSFTILPVQVNHDPLPDHLDLKIDCIYLSDSSIEAIAETIQQRLISHPGGKSHRSVNYYHVIPRETGWAVKRNGSSRASSVHISQADAITAARRLADNNRYSEIVIHRADGTVDNLQTKSINKI